MNEIFLHRPDPVGRRRNRFGTALPLSRVAYFHPGRWLGFVAAWLLSSCANVPHSAETFAARYALPERQGALYQVADANGSPVGWLYGAIHYAKAERPALSVQALRRIDKAKSVYLEYIDEEGGGYYLEDSGAFDPQAQAHAEQAQPFDAEDWLKRARKLHLAKTSDEYMAQVELMEKVYNACHFHSGFGTEQMIFAYVAGKPIVVGQIETASSRKDDFARARSSGLSSLWEGYQRTSSARVSGGSSLDIVCSALERAVAEPEKYSLDAFGVARNRTMADYIALLLESNMRPFVAVGGAHFAGKENILQLLAQKGYRITPED